MRIRVVFLSIAVAIAATPATARLKGHGVAEAPKQADCRIIEKAARVNLLPVSLLTRLLWTESHFQADAVSPKGAIGVAQFMPKTADERGLSDPFDPAEAIPKAARFLAELNDRFENTGLAIAAYNAGSKRVSDWLTNTKKGLPTETQNFVLAVTGHSPAEWIDVGGNGLLDETNSCLALSTSLPTHPFKHAPQVHPVSINPYASASGQRLPPPPQASQYFIGYRKPDGSHESYGRESQYYAGYSDADGSNGD